MKVSTPISQARDIFVALTALKGSCRILTIHQTEGGNSLRTRLYPSSIEEKRATETIVGMLNSSRACSERRYTHFIALPIEISEPVWENVLSQLPVEALSYSIDRFKAHISLFMLSLNEDDEMMDRVKFAVASCVTGLPVKKVTFSRFGEFCPTRHQVYKTNCTTVYLEPDDQKWIFEMQHEIAKRLMPLGIEFSANDVMHLTVLKSSYDSRVVTSPKNRSQRICAVGSVPAFVSGNEELRQAVTGDCTTVAIYRMMPHGSGAGRRYDACCICLLRDRAT